MDNPDAQADGQRDALPTTCARGLPTGFPDFIHISTDPTDHQRFEKATAEKRKSNSQERFSRRERACTALLRPSPLEGYSGRGLALGAPYRPSRAC